MVKFIARKAKNGAVLGLGITAENVKRLQEGKPIVARFRELAPPGVKIDFDPMESEVCIFFGENEEALQKELSDFIGPMTRVVMPEPR